MALKLIANYSKRLGLPGYSSHQFAVSIETELVNTDQVAHEAARVYQLLQTNVDEQIQSIGFVPDNDYGIENANSSTSHHQNGSNGHSQNGGDRWRCSDKQKKLILRIVDENKLDRNEIDDLARQRFGKGVPQLNKMEASGLIDELLDVHGGGGGNHSNGGRRNAYAGNRNGGGR